MSPRRWVLGALAFVGGACLPDNPDLDPPASDTGEGDGGVDLGPVLGCPAGSTCNLLVATQTLDDRIEIFAPDDPGGVIWRGTVDLDLKPNSCAGCGPGDYGAGRLDEPYGVALGGGHLHVVAGHYPSMEAGTLLSFPFALFTDEGAVVPTSAYFSAGAFSGVVATPLLELEPIFVTAVADKLLVGTFNNNLFTAEDAWTIPGRVLVLDAADPSAGIGVVDLGALDGGSCNGAAEIVVLGAGMLGVACDGNEAVARLSHGELEGVSPEAAAASFQGDLCPLAGALPGKRVRYLAADGEGGYVVAEGPGTQDQFAAARIWHFDAQCQLQGIAMLPTDADWQLGQIRAWPGRDATWLFASGSITSEAQRGVFVARASGGALEVCGPLEGFAEHLVDPAGDALQPFALAVAEDGAHVAVGAGPYLPPIAGPGYGKVLWGTLTESEDPCATAAEVIDLTAGGAGAPAVDPADPSTFRRAPHVLSLVQVSG
jgi:hypothetical protein